MASRRQFVRSFASFSLGTTLPFFHTENGKSFLKKIRETTNYLQIDNEDFWHTIKLAYTVSPSLLNLNNGGVSPSPKVVQEAVERYNRLSNESPSYYMWRILDQQGKEPLRQKLADLAGCSTDEVAIMRNTTEALANVIFGLPLKKGDEVVLSKHDYPNMINAWKQREQRDGVVLKWVNLDSVMNNKQEIINRFQTLFTDRTKLVHLTHVINWNGTVLPVAEIAAIASNQGIEVLVDAAHSFAHLDYQIPDLQCDYFGTSLHKWLCAPFGSGMLYVKKEKIGKVYPLMAAPKFDSQDIRKFENIGTRSIAIEQGIGQAIDFHQMIGAARKEKRLRYLKDYWTSRILEINGTSIGTPQNPQLNSSIALLQVASKKPQQVARYLMNQHRIHSVAIDWDNIHGVRISPNVYTLTSDLDRLVAGVRELVKE